VDDVLGAVKTISSSLVDYNGGCSSFAASGSGGWRL
jgi:hypothetical protein